MLPADDHPAMREVSAQVFLHAGAPLRFDVRDSDSSHVGFNPDSTVKPGDAVTYRWYADTPGVVPERVDARHERTSYGCCAAYVGAVSDETSRPARVEDVHELALAMPHVTVSYGIGDNPVYQVGGKSFIFFRTPLSRRVRPLHPDLFRQ